MSRIGATPRDMDRVALRASRRNFEDATHRTSKANMSKVSGVRTPQLRTADLGIVRLAPGTRSIGQPLGAMPVRIDIQPDNAATVYVPRTTEKLIWVTSDIATNARIRVFL